MPDSAGFGPDIGWTKGIIQPRTPFKARPAAAREGNDHELSKASIA